MQEDTEERNTLYNVSISSGTRHDNNEVPHDTSQGAKSASITSKSLYAGMIAEFDEEECQAFISSGEATEIELAPNDEGGKAMQGKDLQSLLLTFLNLKNDVEDKQMNFEKKLNSYEEHQKREKEQEQKMDQEKKELEDSIRKSGLEDTETFHMLAVAAVVGSSGSSTTHQTCGCPFTSLLLVFCSLFLVMTQSFCLYTILGEVSYPSCSTHSDCLTGQYCYMGIFTEGRHQATCDQCETFNIEYDWDFFINVCEPLDEVTNIDGDVDQTYI